MAPRKSGESTSQFRRKAGERRGLAKTDRVITRNVQDSATRQELPLYQDGVPVVSGIHGGLSMADAREVMNIRQASQYLGVSPDTLYKYVSEEKIPAFKLGNRWKFKKSILDTWMENKSLSSEVSRPRKLSKTPRAVVS